MGGGVAERGHVIMQLPSEKWKLKEQICRLAQQCHSLTIRGPWEALPLKRGV